MTRFLTLDMCPIGPCVTRLLGAFSLMPTKISIILLPLFYFFMAHIIPCAWTRRFYLLFLLNIISRLSLVILKELHQYPLLKIFEKALFVILIYYPF
jgi:hypothetical protein